MKIIHKNAAGLDVHKGIIVGTIQVEQSNGEIYEETRKFGVLPEDLKSITDWVASYNVDLTVMESTGVYWKNVYAAFEVANLNAHVVNARHAKNVPGKKTDITDSQWLAQLARYGLLRPSFIPTKAIRELRLLTRYRSKLMGTIASEKNRLHKILDDSGIRITTILSSINGVSSQLIIEGLINGDPVEDILDRLKGAAKTKRSELRKMINQPLSKPHKVVLKTILEHIKSIKAAILELETQILEILEPFKEYWKILQTIPGVGITSAASIIAEIGVDMGRFNSAKHLCAWAGMCPSNNESAGKKKSARVRKGSSFLKKTLCESANAAIRTNSQFKGKYQSLTQRRGYKRTIMAIGHKILRAVYIMFLKFTHYIDPKIDYKEQMVKRNAPRWIRALKEFGYLKGDGSLRI